MKRSLLISFSLIVVVLLGVFLMVQPRVQAAPQAAAISIAVSPTTIPADTTEGNCATGTPYAIYVSATGLDVAQTYILKGLSVSALPTRIAAAAFGIGKPPRGWSLTTTTVIFPPSAASRPGRVGCT